MQRWSKSLVLKEAQKYKTRSEWLENSSASYYTAKSRGWLAELSTHMPKRQNKTQPPDDSAVISESKQYKTIEEWKLNSKYFKYAKKRGLIKTCSQHMQKEVKQKKWTEAKIIAEASKYQYPSEWVKNSSASYIAASKMGILQSITESMSRLWEPKWDRASIELSAKKHTNRSSWQIQQNSAYNAAIRLGILDEVTQHMDKSVTTSYPEINIMDFVKQYYPKAHKLKVRSKKEDLPFVKGFDIDIYIPELRKGIEFNGDYWHSITGLRRGRPNWPSDHLENYHEIKKEFFAKRNISYMEIGESEWKKDRDKCLNLIKDFLGV